jgi:hypothetical protein
MAATWRLLDWERDAIVAAYEDGEKVEAISAEFGVCSSYPSMLARRRKVPPRVKASQSQKQVLALQS